MVVAPQPLLLLLYRITTKAATVSSSSREVGVVAVAGAAAGTGEATGVAVAASVVVVAGEEEGAEVVAATGLVPWLMTAGTMHPASKAVASLAAAQQQAAWAVAGSRQGEAVEGGLGAAAEVSGAVRHPNSSSSSRWTTGNWFSRT